MKFKNLFEEEIEYPRDIGSGEILPIGTLYKYISGTFVNGLINYAGKPIRAYVLQRYMEWDHPIPNPTRRFISINNKVCSFDTPDELYLLVMENPKGLRHTNLSMFGDDTVMLFKLNDVYTYIWNDQDTSDCEIGRFKSSSHTEEEVIALFDGYVSSLEYKSKPLPVECFEGWLSI